MVSAIMRSHRVKTDIDMAVPVYLWLTGPTVVL